MDAYAVDSVVLTGAWGLDSDSGLALSEIVRVLRPAGVFLFAAFRPVHFSDLSREEYCDATWELREQLSNSGLEQINIRTMGGWDASLAQMLGWRVRRRPMHRWLRAGLSLLAWPWIWALLEIDGRRPAVFRESAMITGLSGTARKPVALSQPEAGPGAGHDPRTC